MRTQINKLAFIFFIIITISFGNLLYCQTWGPIGPGISNEYHSIYFLNSNTGYVAGIGVILKTTNAGNTWIIQDPNTNERLSSIQFIDENTGYAAGGYYPASIIRKTTNGGNTWTSQYSGISSAFWDLFFINANTGYVGGDWGHLLKTTNGGNNWILQNTGTQVWLESIYFLNNNTGFIAGQDGLIIKTTNSGTTWNNQTTGTNMFLFSIRFASLSTGYCVGGSYYSPYNHIILKTTDGGNSWFTQKTGTGFWLEYIWLSGTNTAIAVGSNGTILKTNNGGNTWITQTSGTAITLREVFFTSSDTGYIAGHNSIILKTTNGGLVPPLTPVLISPPNGSQVTPIPLLDWNDVGSATSYRLQVSEVANFTTTEIDQTSLTQSKYQVPNGILTANVQYYWRVRARNASGWSPWASAWNFTTSLVGINSITGEIPTMYYLYPNYPNPFNPSTTIKFDVPNSSHVRITIYNNLGKTVSEVVNENLTAGSYELNWEASNYPSGVYFYKIESEEFRDVKRMILIK